MPEGIRPRRPSIWQRISGSGGSQRRAQLAFEDAANAAIAAQLASLPDEGRVPTIHTHICTHKRTG
jgi:hypothetical protein